MANDLLGAWGEELAGKFLRKKGFKVIMRNFSCRQGEIDLIVEDRYFLVFVEVKLRKSSDFANAREFVDHRKQQRIKITAMHYLTTIETEKQPRFDVIEIYAPLGTETRKPTIIHLEDAFQ